MEEIKQHQAGTFCWIDLATTDPEGAKKFYSQLFGWKAVDLPAGEGMTYTMLNINDKPVAALYEMNEPQKAQKLPPHWMSYIAVDDIVKTTDNVEKLGGNVIAPPFDIMDYGKMAMLQEPSGSLVALWQAGNHNGMSYKNIHGTLSWVELGTHTPAKAEAFLTKLFDWTAQITEDEDMPYTTFAKGNDMAAGMYKMPIEMEDLPAHWMPYFAVDNCENAVEKIRELGGDVLVAPQDIGEFGIFSVAKDPQGAAFGLIEPSKK